MYIQIIAGANQHDNVQVDSDITLSDVRDEFGRSFSIPTDSTAIVNGTEKLDDYTLSEGDSVEFRKATGRKG